MSSCSIDSIVYISSDGIHDYEGIAPNWDTLLFIKSQLDEIFAEHTRESLEAAISQARADLDKEREIHRKEFRHKRKEKKDDVKIYKAGYVYLMRDIGLGYYKIGFSGNPTHRERTLQAERPSIELLYSWLSNWKTEQQLHERYKEKRVRGEWFNLSPSDIAEIKAIFEPEVKNVS